MDPILETLQGWDAGRVLALINAVGGRDKALALAAGTKKVTLEDVIMHRFDQHGRRIPKGLKHRVVDANRNYRLDQPTLDYAACLARITNYLNVASEITALEFQAKAEELRLRLEAMPSHKNIFCGVHLPLYIPQMVIEGDLGEYLENCLLAAVEHAYKDSFRGREFKIYRKGELKNAVAWVTESRYGQFLSKLAQGPQVVWYFPTALQGFGIEADREQMNDLADGFCLSGVIDASVALMGWCSTLARDVNTPALDCSANTWQSAERSLYFNARDGKLDFGNRSLSAYEDYSGGLLFVG